MEIPTSISWDREVSKLSGLIDERTRSKSVQRVMNHSKMMVKVGFNSLESNQIKSKWAREQTIIPSDNWKSIISDSSKHFLALFSLHFHKLWCSRLWSSKTETRWKFT